MNSDEFMTNNLKRVASAYGKNDKIDEADIMTIIRKHFDCTCDLCSTELKTLSHAVDHYRIEHNGATGYLKCCGWQFKQEKHAIDHVRWHLNSKIFQ